MENSTECNRFYLFINSKSGGGQGQQYLTLGNQPHTYKFQSYPTAHIRLIDLFDTDDRRKVFEEIRDRVQLYCSKRQLTQQSIGQSQQTEVQTTNIRIVICGGDGTIMWVVQEALNYQINTQLVTFGILPIGTGNDFSRSLGWGGSATHFSQTRISNLHEMVKKWIKARTSFYDIWDVQLETYPSGCFYDIKNQQQIKKDEKYLKKSFSNYCGMGVDARVVYTVQKHRTSFAFLNKVVYGCIGFCNFFKAMRKLNETVQEFRESQTQQSQDEDNTMEGCIKQKSQENYDNEQTYQKLNLPNANTSQKLNSHDGQEDKKESNKIQQSREESIGKKEYLIQMLEEDINQVRQESKNRKRRLLNRKLDQMIVSQPILSQIEKNTTETSYHSQSCQQQFWKTINIRQGYRGIVALNCPSYMAGLRHVWETKRLGRQSSNNQPAKPLKFLPQTYNDGLIQFVGFKSELKLALQRVVRSGAKLAQGTGPYEILMKQPSEEFPETQSFIQIDGQSVKVINLKKITIKKTDRIKNSRINVMVNAQQG